MTSQAIATREHAQSLRIAGLRSRAFEGRSQASLDPSLRIYLADLAQPYGLSLREDMFNEGVGHFYGDMAAELIATMVTSSDPVDLLILAFAMHDVIPGRATAVKLSQVCPGEPMAFAVSDQGNGTAFTALRLAHEYLRTDGYERALLVIVEQAAVHYEIADSAGPVDVPKVATAVAVLCDASGDTRFEKVRQLPNVTPSTVADRLAAELSQIVPPPTGKGIANTLTALIMGNALATSIIDSAAINLDVFDEIVRVPAGRPCTGVWSALSHDLPRWSASGALAIVADYDPILHYLSLAVVRPETGMAEMVSS